jgi:CubicO group peptidase (beta-lactamase class C family)
MKIMMRKLMLGIVAVLASAGMAVAQSAPQPLTVQNLEAWFDGVMPYNLAQNDMAGGEVVVVKDGQILFQKGYGFSDKQKRIPVDIDRTLFRPGSIAKTLTWTAVMQQVEAGRIDLDADVNRYLDFKIPYRFGKPVTMRLLMTHRAGFEERLKWGMAPDVKSIKPLGKYLAQSLPNQLYPPGEVPAYSNWGVTLAGYIVERVSGEPFDSYMERHVLAPIGMARSTFRIPPQPELLRDLSKGYFSGSGEPQHFELDQMRPAGSLSATGPDMGRFMIAHLNQGAGLMKPETAKLMHATAARTIPALKGMSLGFFEADRNGRRILTHGGNSQQFFADLYLFMDDHVGLYVAFNSAGKSDPLVLAHQIFETFDDRYFPAPGSFPVEPTTTTAAAHAALMQGQWEGTRRVQSSFIGIVYVLLQQFTVTANDDGTISVSGGAFAKPDGEAKRWREVRPFQWREVGGHDLIAAKVVAGRPVLFGADGTAGDGAYDRVPGWRSSAWNLPAFGGAVAVLLLTALAWPIAILIRAGFKRPFPLSGKPALAYRLVRIAAVLAVVYVAAWGLVFQTALNDLSNLSDGLDPVIRTVQGIGLLVVAGTVVALWNVWLVWRGDRGWFARVWSVVIALALIEMTWASFAFNLITVGLRY